MYKLCGVESTAELARAGHVYLYYVHLQLAAHASPDKSKIDQSEQLLQLAHISSAEILPILSYYSSSPPY